MTGTFRADHTGLTLHLPLPEALPTILWAAAAALALFLTLAAIRNLTRKGIAKAWRGTLGVLKRHYLALLLPFGILAFTWAVRAQIRFIPSVNHTSRDGLQLWMVQPDRGARMRWNSDRGRARQLRNLRGH